ncbi:hypothetical protein K458DRAFT_427471 [Lentithecium fluviatile CBS 122367]|uniref:DUF7029 domain-containing protein n=1 Tax=Lentithecium fluviatile CBS 122367 TaxID=1168545 RepID=A0A6G1JFD0_9PLEO|nr:hypothetical protein K458DRAFT_427471 [Lentithecium fluviatile CBS 122367]
MLFKIPSLLGALSLLSPFLNLAASAHSVAQLLRERDASSPGRHLKAANRAANLVKRHTNFFTSNELDLIYTERQTTHNEPNFAANVRVKSPTPVLFLEDFEHLAEDIVCLPGYITIEVHQGVDRIEAQRKLLELEAGGLVVTSHYGCNDHGERKVFKIGTVTVSKHEQVFLLTTEQTTWQTSFSKIDVEMYHTTESHTHRPHQELRRRQDSAPAGTETPTHTAPKPTATSTSEVNTLDLTHSLTDKKFLPEDSPVQIGCKNCSTYGSIDFSFLKFTLNPSLEETLTGGLDFGDFWDGGEITLVAHGMGAHVELLTNISLETGDFSFNLYEVPLLLGVSIKGVGSAGLLYAPDVNVNYSINGSFEFTYGFEINVPNDSRLFLDMTDPANSTIDGFQDTDVIPIPFQATADIPSGAFINVNLRHMVQIGFEFDETSWPLAMELGVYLDLPRVGASINHLSDVDENCVALAQSQSANKEVAKRVLTNVYQITPAVDWQVGIAGKFEAFGIPADLDTPFGNGTVNDVPASCMNYNTTSKQYTEASKLVEEAKKNGAGAQFNIAFATYAVGVLGLVVSVLL